MLSVLLRISSPIIRLLLYIWLGRECSLELVGKLALINAVLGVLIFLIPFDYYISLQRHYAEKQDVVSKELVNHFSYLLIVLSALAIPVTVGLIGWGDGWHLLVIPIVIFEVLNHEVNRIILLREEILFSAVLIFLRNGVWPILIFFMFLAGSTLSVELIISVWLFFSILALGLSYFRYRKRDFRLYDMVCLYDIDEIMMRVRSSSKNLMSSMFVRLNFTLDKYFVYLNFGEKALGIYQISFSIASMLLLVYDALVVPRYYGAYFSGDLTVRRLILGMCSELVGITLVIFMSVSALFYIDGVYSLSLLPDEPGNVVLLVIVQCVFLAGYPFTYALTSKSMYRENSLAAFYGFLSLVLLSGGVAIYDLGYQSFVLALIAAMSMALFAKIYYLRKYED